MFGPPKDVEGHCNARLRIGDDYGDNVCTMRCKLAPGHEGPHEERWEDDGSPVIVTWVKDARDEDETEEPAYVDAFGVWITECERITVVDVPLDEMADGGARRPNAQGMVLRMLGGRVEVVHADGAKGWYRPEELIHLTDIAGAPRCPPA